MKIQKIEILSHNLIETEQFYVGVLGFEINEKTETIISFVVGGSILAFRKTDTLKPVYHFAFTVPCHQLYEAQKWGSGKVAFIAFENNPVIDFPNWNAKSLYFLDNNGNVLEFIARFDLETSRDKPFDPSAIVCISEIAFVTDHVNALAEKFISDYQFTYFDKQIQRKDFSVLGDDNGLLILVDSDRNWFPTSIKAQNFWMEITLEDKGNSIVILNNRSTNNPITIPQNSIRFLKG